MIEILKSEERINQIAFNHKFEKIIVEKVLWMTLVLKEISKSQILSNDFALMGGSAIVFLYGKIYRLSVDLDMDYINNPNLGKNDKAEITEKQLEHKKEIRTIADNLGLIYKEIKQDDQRFLQIRLEYTSLYGVKESVEFDLGYRYCHSVLDIQNVEWPNIFNIDNFSNFKIQTFSAEELWASKINAMVSSEKFDIDSKLYLGFKNKIRHLYDSWFLIDRIIKNGEIDLDLLKKLTILFGVTRIKHYEFCRGEALIIHDQKDYDENLYPVLRQDKDIPELLPMKRKVRSFLDKTIFDYNKDESEFIIDYYSKNFRPEKIFDKKIADKIRNMYFYEEMLSMIKRE